MKKIYWIFIFAVLLGCAGLRNSQPVFDHTVIKQLNTKEPSFTLVVENDKNNYYLNQIEDAFIKNKITVYSEESQIATSQTKGKTHGVAVNNRGSFAFGVGKSKSVSTEKTINIDKTLATCIYIFDCYNWTFKVILTESRELIMKGRIQNSFDQEVLSMYKKLKSN
ncbi:MAG: hypothetical protein NTV58_04700 [Deltaproteobacteria bacterium]|nr:hypothetical protein [Deltaproteobacteria bacterium]